MQLWITLFGAYRKFSEIIHPVQLWISFFSCQEQSVWQGFPGIQASNFPFPSLPVAFSNSRSLPVKRECDFLISLPVPGRQKAFPAHPCSNADALYLSSAGTKRWKPGCDHNFTISFHWYILHCSNTSTYNNLSANLSQKKKQGCFMSWILDIDMESIIDGKG